MASLRYLLLAIVFVCLCLVLLKSDQVRSAGADDSAGDSKEVSEGDSKSSTKSTTKTPKTDAADDGAQQQPTSASGGKKHGNKKGNGKKKHGKNSMTHDKHSCGKTSIDPDHFLVKRETFPFLATFKLARAGPSISRMHGGGQDPSTKELLGKFIEKIARNSHKLSKQRKSSHQDDSDDDDTDKDDNDHDNDDDDDNDRGDDDKPKKKKVLRKYNIQVTRKLVPKEKPDLMSELTCPRSNLGARYEDECQASFVGIRKLVTSAECFLNKIDFQKRCVELIIANNRYQQDSVTFKEGNAEPEVQIHGPLAIVSLSNETQTLYELMHDKKPKFELGKDHICPPDQSKHDKFAKPNVKAYIAYNDDLSGHLGKPRPPNSLVQVPDTDTVGVVAFITNCPIELNHTRIICAAAQSKHWEHKDVHGDRLDDEMNKLPVELPEGTPLINFYEDNVWHIIGIHSKRLVNRNVAKDNIFYFDRVPDNIGKSSSKESD